MLGRDDLAIRRMCSFDPFGQAVWVANIHCLVLFSWTSPQAGGGYGAGANPYYDLYLTAYPGLIRG